ncbi:putative baseplate assembly protein [Actinoplanes sp. NPDC051851]|uniref:putative baseplate assembly protein n=1 Tax=Actinoplanes sp. NPDC051851 TaxID=3154753 RepID=UPI003433D9E9
MTSPVLDDLTWDTLMEAVRQQIPAESGGRWTLHAPADPGITLLELFAYLLEQRVYWLDQIPDTLVVAILRLLGLDPPRPARIAGTVLQLAAPQRQEVPAGTRFSRDLTVFTLDDDVTVLPVNGPPRLWAGGRERTGDLAAGRSVPLLGTHGGADELRIAPNLAAGAEAAGAGNPGAGNATLSLLLSLESGSPGQWSPEAVDDVPPPATLTYEWTEAAEDGSPGRSLGAPAAVADGTAGLRRPGLLRLALPASLPPGGPFLIVRTSRASYASPPLLTALAVNCGIARHRETRTVDAADQILDWLRLPGQRLLLPDARDQLLDATVRIRRDGVVTDWRPVPDLTFAGPADPVVVLDRADGAVCFGDGLTGAIPVPGDGPGAVTVDYLLGGGTGGNGGRTGNWFPLEPAPPGVTASNPVPAEGGADPETIDEARLRAGGELTATGRAVTAADVTDLAVTTPGAAVARAWAGVAEHPGYPGTPVPGAVTVRVVPRVPRTAGDLAADDYIAAVHPDPGLLDAVRRRLCAARLIGTELFTLPPRYRPVALRVEVAGPLADPGATEAALRTGLRRYLDPLTGGDDGTGWPFGDPLRPSGLLRVAQDTTGDAAEVTAVAIGLDGAPPTQSCDDVRLRPGELPALTTVSTGGPS